MDKIIKVVTKEGEIMYMTFQCKKCGKEFILITEQYIDNMNKDKYISCAYCGSDNVNVEGKYDGLNKCICDKHTYKKVNGVTKQIR